ncbi:hypothetical protein FP2506_18344 [Fulvimarina pelagi HTCC2506]|uniref:Uncharacterized protein n=2 Tax=Fulvimarina pelagi TaxID=217511 RepID=Q0G0W4_9HYPH|nr:hypothetical protein FP2506_18344 [Fulvimarina pelagi HTCC2506]
MAFGTFGGAKATLVKDERSQEWIPGQARDDEERMGVSSRPASGRTGFRHGSRIKSGMTNEEMEVSISRLTKDERPKE